MEIKWIGSPNYSTRQKQKIECFVVHIAQGSLGSIDSWFKNRVSKVSTHYAIGKSGIIHQYVDDKYSAWGNGVLTSTLMYWANKYPNISPNRYTISIELEGYTGDKPTYEQYEALFWLIHKKAMWHNILLDSKNKVIGHYVIDPINRPNCPGTGVNFQKIYANLGILPMLRLGSNGVDVRLLQAVLRYKLGHYSGNIDGDYGQGTKKAVLDFQRNNGLISDGICGRDTWRKIYSIIA